MTIGRLETPFPGQLRELHGHRQTARVVVVKVSPVHKDSAIKLGLFGFDQVNRTTGTGRQANSMGQTNSPPMPPRYGPADRHKTNVVQKKQHCREVASTTTTRKKLVPTIAFSYFYETNPTFQRPTVNEIITLQNDR
jgi:hypothetical protein